MPGPDFTRRDDVVDAEFISIGPMTSTERAVALPTVLPSSPPIADDLTMLSRAIVAAPDRSSGGPMFWAGGTIVALAAFWASGGHALFAKGSDANADPAGLRIASVVSRVDRSGVKPILLVDGKAVNDGSDAISMPPLQIEIVTTVGSSARYKLGTAGRSLNGGDFFDFSSRLDLPKDGVKTVFVTFAQ